MTSIHFQTRVLAGGRIEVVTPELSEGEAVNVVITPSGASPETRSDIAAFLRSLPNTRTPEEWKQFEDEFRGERDAWER